MLNTSGGLIDDMEMKDRIAEAIANSGKGLSEIARATKKTPAAVTQWLSGETKSLKADTATALEVVTGYRAAWIVSEKGPKLVASSAGNTIPAIVKKRIPLISWVRAGQWSDVQDNFHPGEADEWIDAFDTQPGDSSFALRVTGDSMTSPYPGDRSFPDGTIIIVDPGRASNAGDYVVAKDVDTQQATFKRLVHDGGRWFLKPLNPSYPTQAIDDPAIRVIGRVIEFQTRGKL